MPQGQLKSIIPAFGRTMRRAMVPIVLTAILAFAAVSHQMMTASSKAGVQDQAQLCAVALQQAREGAILEDARALMGLYDKLLAVGTVDANGQPARIIPESPSIRRAMNLVIESENLPASCTVKTSSGSTSAWSIRIPIRPKDAHLSTELIFVFQSEFPHAAWAIYTGLFGAVVFASIFWGEQCVKSWMRKSLASPMDLLTKPWAGDLPPSSWEKNLRSCGWQEILSVAERIKSLGEQAVESQAKARQIEQRSKEMASKSETALANKLRRARDEATIDPLTGTRNRRFLEEELDPLFEDQRRRGQDLCVVMFDLDNFKQLNDTKGHKAGDELLCFTGALLRGAIRPTDHAIRYGGDEFVLLLPNTTAKQALAVAERIVKLFGQYTSSVLGTDTRVTMSAGLAALASSPQVDTGQALMARADDALYKVKKSSKNDVAMASTS